MAFRVIEPAKTEAAGKPKFRLIAPASKPTQADDAFGALSNIYRAIPFADEVNDRIVATVQTAGDIATGRQKLDVEMGKPVGSQAFAKRYAQQRARSKAAADDYVERKPIRGNLAKGVGLAVQAVPAMATGGASILPAVAKPVVGRGLMASSARAAQKAAPLVESAVKASTAAGLGAQVAGYGSEGNLAERQQVANETTLPAMAVGAALPAGIAGAGWARRKVAGAGDKVGTATARIANRVTGGAILNAETEAAKRMGQALKADGLGPAEVRSALEQWQVTGASSPTLMDLAGPNTRALLRSAGGKANTPGRKMAVDYAQRVANDLQDNAIGRTGQLSDDIRTLPQLNNEVAGRISGAAQAPNITAGRGGALVSGKLNEGFDAANARVNAAYGSAREAAPEAAYFSRAEQPQINANLREAVRDYDPLTVPDVSRELTRLDGLSTMTARDIFEARARLSALRADPGVQGRAAGQAVRAIDAQIDDAMERGALSGDPEAVKLWQAAIGERREMGRQFQGDDLIQTLTERELHGAGRATAVAPEDASNAIMGRTGMVPPRDATRDLTRLRDTLGDGSPEWRALQQEWQSRVLGREAGTEAYGRSWDQFVGENPELGRLLMSADDAAGLQAARGTIANAVGDREAIELGGGIMNSKSADFAAREGGVLDTRRPLLRTSAARGLEDSIERPVDGATGVLNRIAGSTRMDRNLTNAFGEQDAALYQDAIGREVQRMQNARFIDPEAGSKTASTLMDEALVDLPPMSKVGLLKAAIDKIRRGTTLTDAEREALMSLGTRQIEAPANLPMIPEVKVPERLMTPAMRQQLARVLASGEGARQANDR